MFENLKHWFDSLQQQSRLFNHADDEGLHGALASVLYHIIAADGHPDARKRREFGAIMQQEFALEEAQIEHLYQAARGSTGDVHADLHTINFYLKHKPSVRLNFMRKLMQLIDIEGVQTPELEIFYETLHEVFPEIRDPSANDRY